MSGCHPDSSELSVVAHVYTNSRPRRLALALIIGVVAGSFTAFSLGRPDFHGDFEAFWWGARLWLSGVNPYGRVDYGGESIYGGAPQFYPLSTLWIVAPVAWLPYNVAGGIVFGLTSAALAYVVTRDNWWRLHVFASGSFVMAASLGQWSPLIMLAALVPAAGPLWMVKPSIGLAALAYRPSIGAAVTGGAVILLSMIPGWLWQWLAGAAQSPQHVAPVLTLGGPLLLLAALRWRTPAGRLLLVMSCVPHLLFFYDELLLWLVPRIRRESVWLTACNIVGTLLWIAASHWTDEPYQQLARPFVVASCYFPALALVLRQPVARFGVRLRDQWLDQRREPSRS
jgi:hypothetical protein